MTEQACILLDRTFSSKVKSVHSLHVGYRETDRQLVLFGLCHADNLGMRWTLGRCLVAWRCVDVGRKVKLGSVSVELGRHYE